MEKSPDISELAAALCAAQPEFGEAVKSKVNPHLKSKYADLGAVWDAAKDALKKHGLSVVQLSIPSEPGQMAIETVLIHKSGQYLSGILSMPLQKADPQGYGAAMTYGRRYGLSALLGICADDDDDGHSASQAPRQQVNRTEPAYRAAAPPPDTKQGAAVDAYRPPVANGMMVMNPGPGLCPACHAPEGKPHAKNCAATLQPA